MTRAFAPERQRRSIRLRGYDYSQAGAYFITVCAHQRTCLFGGVFDGTMHLNDAGAIVTDEWLKSAEIRNAVALDEFVVMPNHFHGIIVLTDVGSRGVARNAPTAGPTNRMAEIAPISGSLGAIIRSFKSAVTKRVNESRGAPGTPVWQRGFHERIIRNDESLNRIRRYIADNPVQWMTDQENPSNISATVSRER